MKSDDDAGFELFASAFVRGYWETVKSGEFPMPPDEPVEESLEELLAEVSYRGAEDWPTRGQADAARGLRMRNTAGDEWVFEFRWRGSGWELESAVAGSRGRESGGLTDGEGQGLEDVGTREHSHGLEALGTRERGHGLDDVGTEEDEGAEESGEAETVDLLGPEYGEHFRPFLEHVTRVANQGMGGA